MKITSMLFNRIKKYLLITLFLLILFFSNLSSAQGYKGTVNRDIDNYISNIFKRYQVPGGAVAVLKNGKVIHKRYYGDANLEVIKPIDNVTLFPLFSTTKIFTTTEVFHLIESKKIALEDRLDTYLNDLPEQWNSIKIKNLLSHSSGLPDIVHYSNLEENQAKNKIYEDVILFKPGLRYDYNQTNFWLLNRIVQKKINVKLYEHIIDHQFFNAKDKVVFSGNYKERIKHRAIAYKSNGEDELEVLKYQIPEYLYGAAGINLTLDEFIKWNEKFNKNFFIKEKTKELLWKPFRYEIDNNFSFGWKLNKGNKTISYGFTGSAVTGFRKFTEHDLDIIFLTNGSKYTMKVDNIIDTIVDIYDENINGGNYVIYEAILKSFLNDNTSIARKTYYKLNNDNNIDFESILNSIGKEFLRLKESELAVEVFKLNVIEHSDSSNTYDSLAVGYERLGNLDKAVENYKKSIELNHNNKYARKRIKDLEKK
ncbi:serine hydrolase [uncultured Aquimarina sp.]|uniref:serine hydrolase n=1 Tax=uncultured Aquimarina sp. TaxID=575652 RepID=UPI00263A00A8|nr:serine hydrolase [uncultured Aquimarina sp.]